MAPNALRDVLLYPDPRLKQIAVPAQPEDVERVGADLLAILDSVDHCIGLAAPQIGELVRVAVVDLSSHPRVPEGTGNGRLVLANPRIVEADGSEIGREGCMSIPDLTANVRRATRIVVEHAGGTIESEGFEARCIQHEIDHLDGILFLDRVSSLVDDVFRRKRR